MSAPYQDRRSLELTYEYQLLRRFGERVIRYWSFNVGQRRDDPCRRAVERALADYAEWVKSRRCDHPALEDIKA